MSLRSRIDRCVGSSGKARRAGLGLAMIMAVSLFAPTLQSRAATSGSQFYVDSVKGSDSNTGTSADRPWQSLSPVNSHAFQPGDVVSFARGSTFSGGLVIGASGTEGSPITFQAYGSGAKPVFTNSGQWSDDITINSSWVVVKDVMLRDAQQFGVHIAKGATHDVVSDSEASGVGIGVGIYGQNNVVTRNNIHDLKMVVNTQGGDDDYGAFAIGLYGSNNEVSYNRMERCKAPSYDYGQDGGTIEFFANAAGNNIHHNWAQDNNGFLEVGGGSATDTRVAYNVSVNNGSLAVFHLNGNFTANVKNFHIENNTVVETAVGPNTYDVIDFVGTPGADTLIVRNNIFYVNQFQVIANQPGYTHDHNVYYFMQGNTRLGSPLGQGEKIADPQFVSLSGGDYHLRTGSPAIGAGAYQNA